MTNQQAANPFDFLFTKDEPRQMPIVHPAKKNVIRCKDGQPAYILVHASNSTAGEQVTRDAFERARADGKRRKDEGLSFAELRELQRDNAARLIAGWRLVDPANGAVQDHPYTPQAAQKLLESPNAEWLRKQVDDFASDDGNFI